jgi:allantoin racemase
VAKRIAHLTLRGGTPGERTRVSADLIAPGYEVELVETEISVYPVDPASLLLSDIAYLEAAMRAQRDGFDGVLIGAGADYGLAAMRAALDIPVVGCGQAGLLTAAGLGQRFSIVTIWPQTQQFIYDRLLRDNPVGQQCLSVRYVTTHEEQATLAEDDNFITQMKAGREHMIQRIAGEIEAAAADGADSVILGCNCMTPVAAELSARSSVPVVDPTAAGYRFLESMLAMGVRHAKDPRISGAARHHLLTGMLQTAGRAMAGEQEDCPVCVLGADGTASCAPPSAASPSALQA